MFTVQKIPPHLEKPDIYVTGWNRLLHRSIELAVRSDRLKPLPAARVISGTVSSRVRVHSRSWFFIPPDEETADGRRQTAEESVGNMPTDETALQKREIETLTRIRVPHDTVKIQDRLNYILQPPIESILSLPTLDMPYEPFPFQRQGIAFLYSAHFAILADEMGLGKTMQAITTIRLLLRTGEIRSVLLVCPKPLISNWQREFELWAPEISVKPIDGSPVRRKWLWQLPSIPVRLANY
jgi:SNF2 family DNA or RNA helicase